jgi:hypothetical protein
LPAWPRIDRVLALPALPVRRQHHGAGDGGGQFGPATAADDVQREVRRGAGTTARRHVPVVHEQHVGRHPDQRVPPGQVVGLGPVRGRRPAVQQAGRSQRVRPGAQPGDGAAARVRGHQRVGQRAGRFGGRRPSGDEHDVGPVDGGQPVLDQDPVAGLGLDRTRTFRGDQELRPVRGAVPPDAEDVGDAAELERRLRFHHDGDHAQHLARKPCRVAVPPLGNPGVPSAGWRHG